MEDIQVVDQDIEVADQDIEVEQVWRTRQGQPFWADRSDVSRCTPSRISCGAAVSRRVRSGRQAEITREVTRSRFNWPDKNLQFGHLWVGLWTCLQWRCGFCAKSCPPVLLRRTLCMKETVRFHFSDLGSSASGGLTKNIALLSLTHNTLL